MSNSTQFAKKAAARLNSRADDLVDRWIAWIQSRVRTRTIQALSARALRNHIGPVLRGLAAYLETPIEVVRSEMQGHLELHAQIRLDQGYDVQELLAEFDGLAQLVSDDLLAYIEETAADDAAGALEVASRLATGLRAIGYVTVGLYRKAEEAHESDLAARLEEFGRTIVHEVRSPLHTILLAADLVDTDEVAGAPEDRRRHVEVIRTAVKRVGDLLDNVEMLALMEGVRSGSTRSSLRSVLQAVLDEMESRAQERGIDVGVEGEVPDLHVEKLPLQLALANLLSNSIKYSDAEKSERWVKIAIVPDAGQQDVSLCRIQIRDNGIGIPAELKSQVVKRGFRAHPDVADGTGLGLAITRDVLNERGGALELESVEGKGTTATVTFRALEGCDGCPVEELAPTDMLRRGVRAESAIDEPSRPGTDRSAETGRGEDVEPS